MRTLGIILVVLAAATLLWGLMPPRDLGRDQQEAAAILQERRFNGLLFAGLLAAVGIILIVVNRPAEPVQAVAVDQWLNISVTAQAGTIIKSAITDRGYPPGSGVRISAGTSPDEMEVKYDLPSSDLEDFVSDSGGVLVFVHKSLVPKLEGKCIDCVNGALVVAAIPTEGRSLD
jgi:Fe-S cluster assembly iron-binding protein IscA